MSILKFLLVAIIAMNPFSSINNLNIEKVGINEPYKLVYSLEKNEVVDGKQDNISLNVVGNVIAGEDVSSSYLDLNIKYDDKNHKDFDLNMVLDNNNIYVQKENVWRLLDVNEYSKNYDRDALYQAINDVYYDYNVNDFKYFKFLELSDNLEISFDDLDVVIDYSVFDSFKDYVKVEEDVISLEMNGSDSEEVILDILNNLNLVTESGNLYKDLQNIFSKINDDSYLNIKMSSVAEGIIMDIDCKLYSDENNYVSLKSNLHMVKSSFDKVVIDNHALNSKPFLENIDTYYLRFYPYNQFSIIWDSTDETLRANTSFVKENKQDNRIINYFVHKDSLYLPLRYISEGFGEILYWDANIGSSFIIKDNVRYDFEGKIIANRTYVKARDFEKLGYKIEYQGNYDGNPNFSKVIITK